MPVVNFIQHLQGLSLQMDIIEGEKRETGTHIKIGYFGKDPGIRKYWLMTFFREKPVITKSFKISIWKIYIFTQNNPDKFDLILVEINRITRHFVPHGKGFILPRWFELLIDVENSLDAVARNDTKKQINKHRLECQERFSDDDLRFFYDRMYRPYILNRHKDSSVMTDFSNFLKRFRRKDSRLFFLMKDNEPVAGSFNFRSKGMIRFSVLGILDGQKEILKMGANRVLYYYMLSYYKQENTDIINFEGTSPLLNDGLTQFKISMRAFPNRKNLYGEKSLWLLPVNETDGLRAVLKSNPFIFIAGNKIYRAVFIDSSELNYRYEFLKLLKKTRFNGIDGTKIYCWNGTEKIFHWIIEEALPDHEVIDLHIERNLTVINVNN